MSNGNYVVDSPGWNGNRGAVTWGNGSTGVTGTISAANSLIGSIPNDTVGSFVTPLSNGNYVVDSPGWNGKRGATTWGDGSMGTSGTVSEANSLIGSNPGDQVGSSGVSLLNNGNYVVGSPGWNGNRGAATWGDVSTGVSGPVSAANSLIGSIPNDTVGSFVTPLSNGNYVVDSPGWNGKRGATTWGDGSTGTSGTVSAANSLVGSSPGDQVGLTGTYALANGNYVVESQFWDSNRGAVTWGNGSTGTSGTVSADNSLVGSNPGDEVGYFGFPPLAKGNYVVDSPKWNGNRGAVTWGNGSTGISGIITADNSLVGSNPGDQVGGGTPGSASIIALTNGNYVVASPFWNNNRGAVTWGNGSTGVNGTVTADNSLIGSNPGTGSAIVFSNPGDLVGYLTNPLSDGNYVIDSPSWNSDRGAVTWGNGSTGTSGVVSADNSLVGSNPGDYVGGNETNPFPFNGIILLSNGNYVVASPNWNSNRGAVTLGNGSTGTGGIISDANSLVGGDPGDQVGNGYAITPLANGNYVVVSSNWAGNRGAATWVSGTSGQTLDDLNTITPQNSLVGNVPDAGLARIIDNPINQTFLAAFATEGGGRVTAGFTDPSQLSYATGQSQSVTLTPDFLTGSLNSGATVVLQASNDITVNSPITVSAGGNGGALTLQAGRSIVINANITTDNGALTLIANDQLANGVVDAERDPGSAVISMAPGTALDTGSSPLTVELADGAGLTNSDSGSITLQTVTAGSVSVVNAGPSAGSDVDLGPVATSGPQSYADPKGTTNVTGNLTAADNPITFNDSAVVNDGVTVDAGASTVNFARSGTQTLQSGTGTSFDNVNHTGSGALQLTSGLAVTGTFTNSAGTFDANDQPVTVARPATVAAGTYLAGMAPQTFSDGLSITGGVFTSSTGPMTVTGGITVSDGQLSGVGTVDAITALGGTLAPGGDGPGVLTVGGSVAFNPASTLSMLLNGTDAGNGYAQLQAGGTVDLAGSSLSLSFGFMPPVGSSFEIVTNTGSAPINGTFNGLAEGAVFGQDGYQWQITYQGGTNGNSVVLTRLA